MATTSFFVWMASNWFTWPSVGSRFPKLEESYVLQTDAMNLRAKKIITLFNCWNYPVSQNEITPHAQKTKQIKKIIFFKWIKKNDITNCACVCGLGWMQYVRNIWFLIHLHFVCLVIHLFVSYLIIYRDDDGAVKHRYVIELNALCGCCPIFYMDNKMKKVFSSTKISSWVNRMY